MGLHQSTQVVEFEDASLCGQTKVRVEALQSGDVLLCSEPVFSSGGACFMRSCLCWKVHHMGLVINPADFSAESHVRRAHPEIEEGKMYVFHALVTGMKVWDLERYISRIREACILPGQAWVRQLQPTDGRNSEFRKQLVADLDAAFEELQSRPYEKGQLATIQAYCDCVEVCGLCQGKQDCSRCQCVGCMHQGKARPACQHAASTCRLLPQTLCRAV
ncbi:Ddx54 [Symbiodinium natans]|uniref:Ddx54 protein n=1 Tax=Symbiodinium natans TaxID=878477 RepID=A0A812SCV1_9DINO|nr:Ddx54 [Symbiodinium natans]